MNLLIDLLPTTVDIEGIEYEINSDFRTSILFELLMQDVEIEDEENVYCYQIKKHPHNPNYSRIASSSSGVVLHHIPLFVTNDIFFYSL